jgi:multimeric flavodoxin WrbA
MKIVAIVGSPRPKGNTNYLVDQALDEAQKYGVETEKVVLSDYEVKPCVGHDDCPSFDSCLQKDDAAWILEKFRTATGVILATPVYYYNVSAQMKAFIDRNYFIYKHGQKYQAETVGIIVVAEQIGIEDTLHTLKQFVDEFEVSDDNVFTASGYATRVGDIRYNPSLIEAARNVGRQMARILRDKVESKG